MVRQVPSRVYQPDTYIVDIPPSVQRKFKGISARFTRENWQLGADYTVEGTDQTVPNTVLAVYFERTLDGQTWEPIGHCTFPGGVQTHPRTGEVVTQNSCGFGFFDAAGNPVARDGDTRIKAVVVRQIRTAVTAETTE